MKSEIFDVTVIGGGASGLAAAISAKRSFPEARVLVIEKNDRVGKKLAVTGNGQCNITNNSFSPDRYHGSPEFAYRIIASFDPEKQASFFLSLGLPVAFRQDGKAYPMSLQASSVVDALRFSAAEAGVNILCGAKAETPSVSKDGAFFIPTDKERFISKTLIIACGGEAGGKLGSDDGYRFLSSFGHRITDLRPAIVQLRSSEPFLRALKGVKVTAALSVDTDKGRINAPAGDLLFCDYGVSGPGVLLLSSYYGADKPFCIKADLTPYLDETELLGLLKTKRDFCGTRKTEELLGGLLQKRLAQTVLKIGGLSPETQIGRVSDSELKRVSDILKSFKINITGTRGMNDAQVTAGGADTAEFYEDTLMSRRIPGLFACGEVLNADGDCGGFNLSFAWASGYTAGLCAADRVKTSQKKTECRI